MTFLGGIVAAIIEWFLGKLEAIGVAWWKTHEAEVAVSDQAAKDEAQLQNAKTQQDKEDAAKTIADHTFGPNT